MRAKNVSEKSTTRQNKEKFALTGNGFDTKNRKRIWYAWEKYQTRDQHQPHEDPVFSPIFDGHHIVEDGVDGGGEVVETPRDVEELLVDLLVEFLGDKVPLVLVKHHEEQSLRVEGRPTDEERENHGR